MNKSSRIARQIVKARRTATRDARRTHTLASHARRAGVFDNDASGVANALRAKAKLCGIQGEAARMFRRNEAGQKMWRNPVAHRQGRDLVLTARRYTVAEVAALTAVYRPRVEKYALARRQLLAYAGV